MESLDELGLGTSCAYIESKKQRNNEREEHFHNPFTSIGNLE